jgi:tetratricopeptide (TPR) repeat protein
LIRYSPLAARQQAAPEPATEPPPPQEIASADELYLTGLHLEQYRHATRRPEDYWQEALRRDPEDVRCNNALGLWRLRRGEFHAAEQHFRTAVTRLTRRNPNPYDGEPYYNLGLTLRFLGRYDEAYGAFYKATWNQAWQPAGYHALAEMDAATNQWVTALDHLDRALRVNSDNLKARNLKAIALRKLGCDEEAEALVQATLALDPLDFWARQLAGCSLRCDNQVRLDMALDMARAGLFAEAADVLQAADMAARDGSAPMVRYTLAFLHQKLGMSVEDEFGEAAQSCPDYCFPNRLEEIEILESAMRANAGDARAPYYLGNLLYARRRCREAIALWEKAAELDPTYSVVWRNLGIGYFNVMHKPRKALQAFDRALQAAPDDARVLYERDQLWKRTGATPSRRLVELEGRAGLVRQRDDLSVEIAALYNQTGKHERARDLLASRQFQPWEGGEGLVLDQYVRTHLALGRKALAEGQPLKARRLFEAALQVPPNIGEAAHLLANCSHVYYWLGVACAAGGDDEAAREWWRKAARSRGDFREMSVQAFSDMTYCEALAMMQLGRMDEAQRLLGDLLAHAGKLSRSRATVDYFATSLPAMLLFEDDLQKRQSVAALFLEAQARFGLGQAGKARKLLKEVLALDRNHAMAADLLVEVAHAQ